LSLAFLEMKLEDPQTVRLSYRHQVILNLDLLTLFGQVAQKLDDVSTNGAHFGILQMKVSQFLKFVEVKLTLDNEFFLV